MPDAGSDALLIRSVRVVPVGVGGPAAQAAGSASAPTDLLVRDGVVVAVGPQLAVPATPGLVEIRAEDRWLIPGLWD
ncbi:MAG: hypothetical protein WAW88_00805, partial [Nocardioides sp.]